MLYPQKGSIANGSKRSSPTVPAAAAVFSEDMLAPRNTPCSQSVASVTSGTTVERRPPNMIASMGTPAGSSHSAAIDGACTAATVKRALGCAAGASESGVQSLPRQSIRCAGGSLVRPSHHTSPSSVSAQLVKIVSLSSIFTAFGLVSAPVPGATPKKPASGLIAYSRPSWPKRIQAMSSPIVSTFQPGSFGTIIDRLVLPHAEGNAPARYFVSPSGDVILRISMCSASQPSSRAITDAMRSARHFLPSSALPPYPDPYDQISRVSGKCTIHFSLLHGHVTSTWPFSSGAPTVCMHG